MRKHRYPSLLYSCVALLFSLLVACRAFNDGTERSPVTSSSYTPVTITTCGITTTYKEPPKRAVTLLQTSTELMLALGLEERMVGTAYRDAPIPAKYQQAYEKIPVLAEKYPSREVILGVEPDFIYAPLPSAFDKAVAGPREELLKLGINSYLEPSICDRPEQVTMEVVYREILDIGRIFGVEGRAQALVAELKTELEQVQQKLGKIDKPKRIFWYDSEDPPLTAACCGMPNQVISLAGGVNIFRDLEKTDRAIWSTVNWEEAVARDPEVIGLTDATWSTADQKRQLLKSNPAYAKMKAVREDQFVTLEFNHIIPSIRNVEGIRRLAKALYPERFQ